MALNEEQEARVQSILDAANDAPHKLNDWEKKFLADQQGRFEKYGAGISLSMKQWQALERIFEKVM